MPEHLSNDALVDLAAGAEGSTRDRDHLAACPACAGRLAEAREMMARLDALPGAADAPAGLWERVAERIQPSAGRPPAVAGQSPAAPQSTPDRGLAGSAPRARWALRAAAALGFFLAGAVAQAAWTEPGPGEPAPGAGEDPLTSGEDPLASGDDPPTSGEDPSTSGEDLSGGAAARLGGAAGIQRAGTAWVTAIAAIAARAPGLPEDEVATAREVAYAAMFGAAHELAALDGADPASEDLYRRAREAWLDRSDRGAP